MEQTPEISISQPIPAVDALPVPDAPPYRLYKLSGIGLATFLASPLAGCWFAAANFRRLGLGRTANKALIWGVIGTAVLLIAAFLVPDRFPSSALPIGATIAMYQIIKPQLLPLIDAHQQRGGLMRSNWAVVPISLVILIIVLAIVFGGVILFDPGPGLRYAHNDNEEIYYSGQATESDARLLAERLTSSGYFTGQHHASVLLEKRSDGAIISFVIGQWPLSEEVRPVFQEFGRRLQAQYADVPLTIRVVDSNLDRKADLTSK